ncbi:MAG: YggT family protein [Desulfovibrio sp.]|jgi:YggT family protein|nr:YggT family protein [Desulfovibrio sp.]
MIILMSLIEAVDFVAASLINIYFFIVIGACVVSWVNADPYNPIVRVLRQLTEPAFWRIRKWLPFTYTRGLDFSPIVLLLALQILQKLISGTLRQAAVLLAG